MVVFRKKRKDREKKGGRRISLAEKEGGKKLHGKRIHSAQGGKLHSRLTSPLKPSKEEKEHKKMKRATKHLEEGRNRIQKNGDQL